VSERLRAALARRAVPAGGRLEHHAILASTNDRLRELARDGAPEWSVVVADEQSAGRGRFGHGWASPPGNLFLSVLLRPALLPSRVTLLPLAAGTAVAEAVGEWGVAAALKWPNDVLAGDRKLAGILVESTSGASGIESAIVGVGVNVLLDPASLAEDLSERTASIRSVTGASAEPLDVGAAVLARLAVWYHALHDGASALVEAWRALSVPWWGREIEVRSEGVFVRGRLEGIEETGALLLRAMDGALVRIVSGQEARLASCP
jgi:BirA family biotin operon repressor/biotin-[acetyl-CoA-carboxylase] ligase